MGCINRRVSSRKAMGVPPAYVEGRPNWTTGFPQAAHIVERIAKGPSVPGLAILCPVQLAWKETRQGWHFIKVSIRHAEKFFLAGVGPDAFKNHFRLLEVERYGAGGVGRLFHHKL